jgi:hypothetical protein
MLYKVSKTQDQGIVNVMSELGEGLWVRNTLPQRKNENCMCCGRELKGKFSYRPMGNAKNRKERICDRCIEKSKKNK